MRKTSLPNRVGTGVLRGPGCDWVRLRGIYDQKGRERRGTSMRCVLTCLQYCLQAYIMIVDVMCSLDEKRVSSEDLNVYSAGLLLRYCFRDLTCQKGRRAVRGSHHSHGYSGSYEPYPAVEQSGGSPLRVTGPSCPDGRSSWCRS